MRGSRAMVLATAALLVGCSVEAHQEQKEHSTGDSDGNLDLLSELKLIRDKRESSQLLYPVASSNRIKRDPVDPPPVEPVEPNPHRLISENDKFVVGTDHLQPDSPVTEDDLAVIPLSDGGVN